MARFFWQQYPVSVFFILVSELCERFSFYGMKAVLWIYINEYLGYLYIFIFLFISFAPDPSTSIYHAFVSGAYFVPIIGGILSDAYLGKTILTFPNSLYKGKFKTILYLSLVYCLGNIVMSVTAGSKYFNKVC